MTKLAAAPILVEFCQSIRIIARDIADGKPVKLVLEPLAMALQQSGVVASFKKSSGDIVPSSLEIGHGQLVYAGQEIAHHACLHNPLQNKTSVDGREQAQYGQVLWIATESVRLEVVAYPVVPVADSLRYH